jgi:hypothetical protein
VERRLFRGTGPVAEHQVGGLVEGDRVPSEDGQAPARPDRGHPRRDAVDIHGVRLLALEAQQDGHVRGVAAARRTQRAVELGPHAGHALEHARPVQPVRERGGRPHRPDRVRAGRADADLEQVERADRHGTPLDCGS